MALFQRSLPSCCSVGFMHGFGGNGYGNDVDHVPSNSTYDEAPTSGSFIAIFDRNQKASFDRVCRKHKLISAIQIKGGHGVPLAVCIFKWGK